LKYFCNYFLTALYSGMSNTRSPGQVNISLWLDQSVIDAIDRARKIGRPKSRSQFIRIALQDYLRVEGAPLPEAKFWPPDAIKSQGGYSGPRDNRDVLNDQPRVKRK